MLGAEPGRTTTTTRPCALPPPPLCAQARSTTGFGAGRGCLRHGAGGWEVRGLLRGRSRLAVRAVHAHKAPPAAGASCDRRRRPAREARANQRGSPTPLLPGRGSCVRADSGAALKTKMFIGVLYKKFPVIKCILQITGERKRPHVWHASSWTPPPAPPPALARAGPPAGRAGVPAGARPRAAGQTAPGGRRAAAGRVEGTVSRPLKRLKAKNDDYELFPRPTLTLSHWIPLWISQHLPACARPPPAGTPPPGQGRHGAGGTGGTGSKTTGITCRTRGGPTPCPRDPQDTSQDVAEARAHTVGRPPAPPPNAASLCTPGPHCARGPRGVGAGWGDAQPGALTGKVMCGAGRAPQGPPETLGGVVRHFRPREEPSARPGDSGGHGKN
ncbi:translation initiation factor IF-2-like [Phoca vitulina]|uniref:translation initiation factor IF-2-like n=1 Tax=Phoca vitulina TaxID=9720 RepID=UPI001396606E|nr:translation initiation factor IF-2-like [Phoca vitulina]